MSSLFIEPHVGDGQRTSDSASANAAKRPQVKQRKYTPIPSSPREAAIVCRNGGRGGKPDKRTGRRPIPFPRKESTTLARLAASRSLLGWTGAWHKNEECGRMEFQQSPTGGDGRWRDLLAQYELVQMAAGLAFQALIEAYKPRPDGMLDEPSPEVLLRYKRACALRVVAEQALLDFVESNARSR